MFEIEKGVETPAAPAQTRYPFAAMDIDDSFALPAGLAQKITNAACAHASRHGKKFSVRKMPDGSYRCWRVA